MRSKKRYQVTFDFRYKKSTHQIPSPRKRGEGQGEGLTPLHFMKILTKLTCCSSSLEGSSRLKNSLNGYFQRRGARENLTVVKTFSREGSKTQNDIGLGIIKIIKTKKIPKKLFLDFVFNCFVAFLNQNFILISKTTRPRYRVASAPCPALR